MPTRLYLTLRAPTWARLEGFGTNRAKRSSGHAAAVGQQFQTRESPERPGFCSTYLAACQGIEFRRPARSSEALEAVVSEFRSRVPSYGKDRFFARDIDAIKELVRSGWFLDKVPREARLT